MQKQNTMRRNEHAIKEGGSFTTVLLFAIVIISLGFSVFFIVRRNLADSDFEHFLVTRTDYYALSALIIAALLLLYRLFGLRIIYAIIAIGGTLYIFTHPYFAPIDEKSHFAYVYYVSKYNKLPILQDYVDNEILSLDEHIYPSHSHTDPSKMGFGGHIYEAFQPPLYYILATVPLKMVSGNLIMKLYAVRFFGLICILISTLFIHNTYNLLIEKEAMDRNDFLFFSTLLLFTLNPGVMLRTTTVSNLHLLIPLASLFFYVLAWLSYLNDFTFNHTVMLSLLSAALILTHFITIFVVLLVLTFIFSIGQYKKVPVYMALLLMTVLPWCIFNFFHYGQFTANTIAKDMQKILVNPHGERYGLTHVFERISGFLGTFWNPQEAIYPWLKEPNTMITDFLSIWLLLILAYSIYTAIHACREHGRRFHVTFLFTLSVVFNIAMIVFITVFESWDVLIGRYMYLNMCSLVLLAFYFMSDLTTQHKKVLSFFFLVMVVFLYNDFFVKIIYEKDKNLLLRRETLHCFALVPDGNNNIGPITKSTKITQTFISPKANLTGIYLYVSTFMQNIKTPYKLILKDETCTNTIREINLKIAEIRDNAFLKIKFASIRNSEKKKYCFMVEPVSEIIETPITLQLSAPDIYQEGEAILNGEKKKEDIVFQLVYRT